MAQFPDMDKTNREDVYGIRNLKLPIGYRFHPTDEELLLHYLRRKAYSLPLPASVIPESDVFDSNPWDLPGDSNERRYFFCTKENAFARRSSGGYWKAIGKSKQIAAPGATDPVIGIKQTLVFCQGRNSSAPKSHWRMHQFSLLSSINTPYSAQNVMFQMGNWVVCRVYQRKRKARNRGSNKSRTIQIKSRTENNNQLGQISSSCSSGITEISSSNLDEEATSCSVNL